MARGDAKREMGPPEPPEGVPSPDKVLMCHAGKGYRWIPKGERKSKEKWGYSYVREYTEMDKPTGLRLEQMTAEQLRMRAEALDSIADGKERELNETEKKYVAAKEAKERETRETQEHVAAKTQERADRRARAGGR